MMQSLWDFYRYATRATSPSTHVELDISQLDSISRHADQLSYRTAKLILETTTPKVPCVPVLDFTPDQVRAVCPQELRSCLKPVEQTLGEIAESHSKFDGMVLHTPRRALIYFDKTGEKKNLFGLKCSNEPSCRE